jgi:CheY-like chemotaxis protein
LNDNHCGDHLVTSIPDQQTSSLLDKNDSLTSNVEQEYYTYTHKDYESPVAFKKRTYNVVCIDDSSTYLKLVKLFLGNNIFNIITIDNAVDALVETVKNKPDIILLDIMMADIDGHEFCKLLRQSKTFQNTPVIMMTSLNDPKNRELAEINGASDYLAKPFNKTDLLKILFKFL